METGELLAERARVTSHEPRTDGKPEETLADRMCMFSAMGGVVCGVIAGAVLGHSAAPSFPEVFGALGGILGGLVAAVTGQCVLLPAWIAHERKKAHPGLSPAMAFKEAATPSSSESPACSDGTGHPDITASSPPGS
jgi:hypothetical protein